jgi:two-component system cell cycle sensor histidine kinase/response regulator CckA
MPAPTRTVLIVDDDPSVLDLQRRILQSAGFTVMEATDGTEALAILKGDTPLTLVVSDVEMPNLNGDDMAREVAAVRPGLKILFVTGAVDKLYEKEWRIGDDRAFLSKPFTAAGLIEAVSLLRWGTLRPSFGSDA